MQLLIWKVRIFNHFYDKIRDSRNFWIPTSTFYSKLTNIIFSRNKCTIMKTLFLTNVTSKSQLQMADELLYNSDNEFSLYFNFPILMWTTAWNSISVSHISSTLSTLPPSPLGKILIRRNAFGRRNLMVSYLLEYSGMEDRKIWEKSDKNCTKNIQGFGF